MAPKTEATGKEMKMCLQFKKIVNTMFSDLGTFKKTKNIVNQKKNEENEE